MSSSGLDIIIHPFSHTVVNQIPYQQVRKVVFTDTTKPKISIARQEYVTPYFITVFATIVK